MALDNLRKKMNENPALTTGVTLAIVLIALVWIVAQVRGCGGGFGDVGVGQAKAYFATEDGQNLMQDDATLVPPFDKGGKTYYRAKVYKCAEGSKQFVNHLEKYPDDIKKKMEDIKKDDPQHALMDFKQFNPQIQVKRPGDKSWVSINAKSTAAEQTKYHDAMIPRPTDCPGNKIQVVEPGETAAAK